MCAVHFTFTCHAFITTSININCVCHRCSFYKVIFAKWTIHLCWMQETKKKKTVQVWLYFYYKCSLLLFYLPRLIACSVYFWFTFSLYRFCAQSLCLHIFFEVHSTLDHYCHHHYRTTITTSIIANRCCYPPPILTAASDIIIIKYIISSSNQTKQIICNFAL